MSIKTYFRSTQWSDKLVDLLVVILGITIAFGVDRWADSRRDDQTKRQYLVSLSSDLQKDSVRLQSDLANLQMLDTTLSALLGAIALRDLSKSSSIAKMLLTLGNNGTFAPEDYTYQALRQTGNIGLLTNDSLQVAILKLYDIYEKIEFQQETFRTIHFDYTVPFYFNYDDLRQVVVDPEIYFQPKLTNVLLAVNGNASSRRARNREAIHQLELIQRLVREELE